MPGYVLGGIACFLAVWAITATVLLVLASNKGLEWKAEAYDQHRQVHGLAAQVTGLEAENQVLLARLDQLDPLDAAFVQDLDLVEGHTDAKILPFRDRQVGEPEL